MVWVSPVIPQVFPNRGDGNVIHTGMIRNRTDEQATTGAGNRMKNNRMPAALRKPVTGVVASAKQGETRRSDGGGEMRRAGIQADMEITY